MSGLPFPYKGSCLLKPLSKVKHRPPLPPKWKQFLRSQEAFGALDWCLFAYETGSVEIIIINVDLREFSQRSRLPPGTGHFPALSSLKRCLRVKPLVASSTVAWFSYWYLLCAFLFLAYTLCSCAMSGLLSGDSVCGPLAGTLCRTHNAEQQHRGTILQPPQPHGPEKMISLHQRSVIASSVKTLAC